MMDGPSSAPEGDRGGATNQGRVLLLLMGLARSTVATAVDLLARLLPGFQAILWLANLIPGKAKRSFLQMIHR